MVRRRVNQTSVSYLGGKLLSLINVANKKRWNKPPKNILSILSKQKFYKKALTIF